MKKKTKTIAEKFAEFLADSLGNEWVKFPYANDVYGQGQKTGMTIALILWKFLRKFSDYTGCYGWTEKRAFIADFLLNNPLAKEHACVRIVAKIEALPTTIWRKLLWRENIDFADYEPCLRRLSFDQQYAIEQNYADLFNDKLTTPSVLRKSWRDRVKLFFGMMSPDKLLNEHYDAARRNQSKGAYAFSLLGLDFGFSLYPHGDDNDQKITNQKYTRFFSVKAHINDFIVNKEDGKYWWLYKTARSNYAFWPNKEVQMKKHVCPGFWLTLILQSLFWIVSPIALTITALVISKYGFVSAAWIPASFAFAMIIWTFVFVLRTIANLFNRFARDNKVLQIIGATIGITILVALLLFVICAILFFIGTAIAGLAPVVGSLLSAAFVLSAAFYVVFFFTNVINSNGGWFEYSDVPAFVRYLLHLSVGAFIIVIFDKFAAAAVINFIVYLAQTFWQWYTFSLLLSNWFILSLVFFGLFVYFYNMFIYDEKRFASFQKTFTWLTRGFMTITIIIFAVLLIKSETFHLVEFGLAPTAALSFLFLAVGFSFVMLDQVNKANIDERMLFADLLSGVNDKIGSVAYKSYITRLMKSKWLLLLDKDEKWLLIDKIQSLSFTFFEDYPEDRTNFIDLMATSGSVEIVDYLNEGWREIMGVNTNRKEKYLLVQLVVNGSTVDEAIQTMERKRTVARKVANRMQKTAMVIIFPFVAIWQAICWVFRQIGQFFGTLKDLWDFFNKRCPFVTQPRYLD